MPNYTYAQLKSDVNAKIKGKAGILIDARSTLNQGVREVLSQVDMVSMRRRKRLVPNLFSGLFEYDAPEDLKAYGIITIENQKWSKRPFWKLVPYEEFMRRQENFTIGVSDYDFQRKIFIKSDQNLIGANGNINTVLSNLDTLTSGGGTWIAFGDATDVEAGSDNFVEGTGSVKFNVPANSTTAGIQNLGLTPFDATAFLNGDGNSTVWSYLTNKDEIDSFTLRLGSDSSNYYEKTITGSFVDGWNNLDFDLSTFTTVGSPVITAITYCAVFFNLADAHPELLTNGSFTGGTAGWTLQTL